MKHRTHCLSILVFKEYPRFYMSGGSLPYLSDRVVARWDEFSMWRGATTHSTNECGVTPAVNHKRRSHFPLDTSSKHRHLHPERCLPVHQRIPFLLLQRVANLRQPQEQITSFLEDQLRPPAAVHFRQSLNERRQWFQSKRRKFQ